MKYLREFIKAVIPPADAEWWGKCIAGGIFYALGMWAMGFIDQPRIYFGGIFLMSAINIWKQEAPPPAPGPAPPENPPAERDVGPKEEITAEMLEAGSSRLDELLIAGGGLMCSPTYAAEEVYLAMEKARMTNSSNVR